VDAVTSPQGPWQQGGYSPYQPQGGYQYPQQGGYPQYQQGNPYQAQYPQSGQYPPSNPYAAPPVPAQNTVGYPRPAPVNVAFWIGIVVPIVATVLGVLNFVFIQSWLNGLINSTVSGAGADPAEAQNVQHAASTAVILVGGVVAFFWLILTVLWIVFSFKLRAGRNWARITLTVFASIWAVSGVYSLINAAGGGTGFVQLPAELHVPNSIVISGFVSGAIGLVSMATFIAMVFLKPSNWYFQAHGMR
jgi:hypothetical protein